MTHPYTKTLALTAAVALAQSANGQTADQFTSEVANAYYGQGYTLCPATPGCTPPVSSRAYGYMGIALYEAVVDGIPGYSSLQGDLPDLGPLPAVTPGLIYHWPTCANYALSRIMDSLFFNAAPANLAALQAIRDGFDVQFSGEPVDVIQRSQAFGTDIAEAVLDMARTDGQHRPQLTNFDPLFVPPVGPGLWVPAVGQQAMQPYWGNKRPFLEADTSFTLFNSTPPAFDTLPGSPCYDAAALVYQTSLNLTTTDTLTARYWADGVVTPPTHSMSMMEQLMRRENKDLAFAARGYAMLGMSIADAFVACWRWKYIFNWNRPRNFIRDHIDPNWASLITTPPFPECSSGHSSQSGAWSSVMEELFGSSFSFVDSTHGASFGGPRTYSDFASCSQETAYSRLLGGIHYEYSNSGGLQNGEAIGDNIIALFDGLITGVNDVASNGTVNIRYDAVNDLLVVGATEQVEQVRVISCGSGALVNAFDGPGPYHLSNIAPGMYAVVLVGDTRQPARFVVAE